MEKGKLRVFLDSNVVISGLFSAGGAPRIILDLLSLGLPMLSGVTGEYNLAEIERNLLKKMPEVLPRYREYLSMLHLEIVPIPSPKEIRHLKGQTVDKDLPVLASAISAGVDFLITGDKKDFGKATFKSDYPFRVVTPSEFVRVALPDLLRGMGEEHGA